MDFGNSNMEICLVKSGNNSNFVGFNSDLRDNRKQLLSLLFFSCGFFFYCDVSNKTVKSLQSNFQLYSDCRVLSCTFSWCLSKFNLNNLLSTSVFLI